MDDNKIKCIYCSEWTRSSVIKRNDDEQDKKHKLIKRKCAINNISISIKSEACKYFRPAGCFYCNANNHYITFLACLNRRLNPQKLTSYEKCATCRQFETDIKQAIEKFWINKAKIIQSPTKKEPRRIKRRKEKKEPRRIKRRKEKKEPRRIKRRKE